MTDKKPHYVQKDELTLRDEANAITAHAFRNGLLENLHAGKDSSLLKDPANSRITQEEMKKIMIEASAKVELLLYLKQKYPEEYQTFIQFFRNTYCKNWDREAKEYTMKEEDI